MIIKGGSHSGRGLGAYLFQDKNERAELWGIRGVIPGQTINEAIATWQGLAYTTTQKCEKPLYHAQLNPDRVLSTHEWEQALAVFEKEMGFENQPRAVVFHSYKGREHVHLVYSRIENGRAISDSWNYLHHEKASREIEKELGLEHTQGALYDRKGTPRPERQPDEKQTEQGKRTEKDPKAIKAEVSELYANTQSGEDFIKALDDAGYTLARGDKRGYVILDEGGGIHSLSRVAGTKAADLRNRLKSVDLDSLPSVEQARDMQDDRAHGRESIRERMEWEDRLHTAAIEQAKVEITQPVPAPEPQKAAVEEKNIEQFAPPPSRARTESRDDGGGIAGLEKGFSRGMGAMGNGVCNVAEVMTDAIEHVMLDFIDPKPPQPTIAPEKQTEKSAAEVKNKSEVDWQRYATDRAYRQELWRREIVEAESQQQRRQREDNQREPDELERWTGRDGRER